MTEDLHDDATKGRSAGRGSGAPARSLATLLREGTADAHRAAERSPFMAALLRGRVDRAGYAAYLASLRPIYDALEGTRADLPAWLRAMHPPALLRLAALDRDLAVLTGGASPPAPAAPALAVAERIRAAVADGRPHRWLAHAYVRYLGDLSGGQALAGVVRRALELEGDEGVAFYRFPELGDPGPAKAAYRQALDAAPLDESARQATLDEALAAFEAHGAIFRALPAPGVDRSVGSPRSGG